MSEKRKYVSVILPLKLEWEPCYYLPAGIGADVVVGTRVMVRFAGKSYVGAVSATGIVPEVEDRKIMPILSVVEGLPPVSRGELELWRFVAEYYLCTIGEVYKAAYPSLKIGMEMSRARQEERRKSLIDKKIAALRSKKAMRIWRTRRSVKTPGRNTWIPGSVSFPRRKSWNARLPDWKNPGLRMILLCQEPGFRTMPVLH